MVLHELTFEHQCYAECHHNLVYAFLRDRKLDIDDYYDIVIFGYLHAVQEYCDCAELRDMFAFSTIAWRKMADKLNDHFKKQAQPMRKAVTFNIDTVIDNNMKLACGNAAYGIERVIEELDAGLLWKKITAVISEDQAELLHMRAEGYSTREIAVKKKLKRREIDSAFAGIQESLAGFCLA